VIGFKEYVIALFLLIISLHLIVWISAAVYVVYKTNFFRQVFESDNVNRFFLDLAFTGIGLNISIMLYMTVYLPYIAHIDADLEQYCPRLIPVITLSGVLSFLLYYFKVKVYFSYSGIMGLWPLFGLLTPVYMFILFMGYTMVLLFLPSGFIGTIMFWGLCLSCGFTSHFIPHEPLNL
jgi:hypothetical protein